MIATYLNRIEIQLLRDFVQVNFQRVTRLWRSMPAFRPARRLVSEDAHPVEFIPRHFVSNGLQSPGIERARHSVTSISSAIKKRFEVHRGNGAVFFHTCLYPHQDRMSATMTVKDLFAR